MVESAADTFTAVKFAFPFSIMDKMALVISRIEYLDRTLGVLNSSGDYKMIGLAASASIVDPLAQNDPLIIDNMLIDRNDFGTAAAANLFFQPYVKDFANVAGGGLLVAPAPLYGYVKGAGESGASTVWIKLFYTYMELDADSYWQLVESRRIISN